MYSITVRNNILIAHSLPGEVFGPAQNMHGATYIVDAEFYAKELNNYNIIMDLGVVTNILASYRGFDTLGETIVIFTAGLGVIVLLTSNTLNRKTKFKKKVKK